MCNDNNNQIHKVQYDICKTSIKTLSTVDFFEKLLKNSKRKRIRGKCKTVQESVKTEQFVKTDFSKIVTLLKSKNFELMKVP